MSKIMTLTRRAAERVAQLVKQKNDPTIIGVRVGLKTRGCNGLSYTMDYARKDAIGPLDEVVEDHSVTAVVDSNAVMFLLGSQMDYKSDALSSEFVFENPNATGECGCGQSFTTQDVPT